jgi:membrane-bound lytic murein transglycosylase MltF
LKRAILHIIWVLSLAIVVLTTAGECVAPGPLLNAELRETVVLGEPDPYSVSPNSELCNDLEYVDEELLKEYSAEYGIDFRLVLAMIKHESSFDENAVSERGAEGLMQIMPVTHMEISGELEARDPLVPHNNIRSGVHYVAKLCELFREATGEDKIGIILAAYNAGPARIYDAQELAAYLGENPRSWHSIRNVLPLLSKRYYSLHQAVWDAERPPNGCFGCARQTIQYVDNILKTYHAYRQPA